MHLSSIHDRLIVWGSHAQIKCGDDFCTDVVFTGYIDTGLQFDMVNGEAGYFFHKVLCDDVFYRVMAVRSASVTANERSAIVSQKFWYWSKWPSAPGVSLMMRNERKGVW